MTIPYPVSLPGVDNVAMWADPAQIEPAAQEQLRNVARRLDAPGGGDA